MTCLVSRKEPLRFFSPLLSPLSCWELLENLVGSATRRQSANRKRCARAKPPRETSFPVPLVGITSPPSHQLHISNSLPLHLRMAARIPLKQLSRKTVFPNTFFSSRLPSSFAPTRTLATVTPSSSSPGPNGTAIVLLNMGGPSTVPEVQDFLSRLFVCFSPVSLISVQVRN